MPVVGRASQLVASLSRPTHACTLTELRFRGHAAFIPNDHLALTLGGGKSLHEITPDQMRGFADVRGFRQATCGSSPVETAESAATAWETLPDAELFPKDLRQAIAKQILHIAAKAK